MKISISSSAKSDLSEIVKYIAEDNPGAARNWFDGISKEIINGINPRASSGLLFHSKLRGI